MLVDLDILVVFWAVALFGQVNYMVLRWKWLRSGTIWPVRGVSVAVAECRARLEDLAEPRGNAMGLAWARTPFGIVCRAASDGTVVLHGEQQGDVVVINAVVPWSLALSMGGLLGFLAVATLFAAPSAGWLALLPVLLTAGFGAAIGARVVRARATARRFARDLAALCTGSARKAWSPP